MNVSSHPLIAAMTTTRSTDRISLPAPRQDSGFSLERALHERRSVREFGKAALTQEEVSQLLWAAQGITSRDGLRTAPSAGALYPLELYLVAGNVQNLDPGIYKYVPPRTQAQEDHGGRSAPRTCRRRPQSGLRGQCCRGAVFTAVERRTTRKYGSRGVRYMHIEVGHAAQNVFLQATALGLGAVVVGSFDDDRLRETLKLPEGEAPLYLMPLGRP